MNKSSAGVGTYQAVGSCRFGPVPVHLIHRKESAWSFFRVLGTRQSGSGLVWSIVRRIAAAHGACIDVGASSSLGGMAVKVRFVR